MTSIFLFYQLKSEYLLEGMDSSCLIINVKETTHFGNEPLKLNSPNFYHQLDSGQKINSQPCLIFFSSFFTRKNRLTSWKQEHKSVINDRTSLQMVLLTGIRPTRSFYLFFFIFISFFMLKVQRFLKIEWWILILGGTKTISTTYSPFELKGKMRNNVSPYEIIESRPQALPLSQREIYPG